MKLKSDDPGLLFDDTSASPYAANDWALQANEPGPGALNGFYLRNITGSTTPFSVAGGAPTDSLKIGSTGNVGIGTDNPVLDVSIRTNDTPGIRMEQTNVGGFAAPDLGRRRQRGELLRPRPHERQPPPVAYPPRCRHELARHRALPVMKAELASDTADASHLSPVGADFRAAFGLGSSDSANAPSEMAGVALVGVQALAARVDDLDASRVGTLSTRIDALEKTIAATSVQGTEITRLETAIAMTSGQSSQIEQLVTSRTAAKRRMGKLKSSNRAMAKRLTALEKKLKRLAKTN
jgi:hypothetical protein